MLETVCLSLVMAIAYLSPSLNNVVDKNSDYMIKHFDYDFECFCKIILFLVVDKTYSRIFSSPLIHFFS
jgi:hypothetical protein